MRQFDILESPLKGTHLIEASAGTGKTYAIAGLFLRLILERRLSPGDILVVTFTNAATAELRERIRSKIRNCLLHLAGSKTSDKVIEALLNDVDKREEASMRLRSALQGFDEASIHTIHGFCGRMLRENPFESGSLFDTKLVTDQDELVMEVIRDFWRIHLSEESLLFLAYARDRIGIEGLGSFYGSFCRLPVDQIIPLCDKTDTGDLEKRFIGAFTQAASLWRDSRDDVAAILSGFAGLNRRSYPPDKMEEWVREMERFLSRELLDPRLFPEAVKFSQEYIMASTRKGFSPPDHIFFKAWQDLMDLKVILEKAFEDRIMALQRLFFEYAGSELKKRKTSRNIAYFDDLLTGLHNALHSDVGQRLATAIAGRYKAALIDEFQDTDPIQYEIFRKVFSGDEKALFLIGDPKQAIYGFRGADIFTYMKASRDIAEKSTLIENWRSRPSLIGAVNAVFGACARPFIFDEIPFERAKAAKDKKHDELLIDGTKTEPFIIWYPDKEVGGRGGDSLNKTDAVRLVARAVSSEIAGLIMLGRQGRALIGDRPLVEGDMAVLVRKNSEADLIKDSLSRLGVPAVLNQMGSVFETEEASEMQRLLNAAAKPGHAGTLKAALATRMLGFKGENLDEPDESGNFMDEWISAFRRYGELWLSRGFASMFRDVMTENRILERLAAMPDGERRATNMLHLAELLHKASLEQGRGMRGLLRWLADKRGSRFAGSDEYQLRLESDERAVKIVTVHRSKGLQYPVVFCPFMWAGTAHSGKKGPHALFHNEKGSLVLDIGSSDIEEDTRLAQKEALAEELRILYVALTRACNRCYLIWTSSGGKDQSALDFLIGGSKGSEDISAEDSLPSRLEILAGSAVGAIKVEALPERVSSPIGRFKKHPHLSCRSFSGLSNDYPRIASFTSLTGYASGSDPRYRASEQGSSERNHLYSPVEISDNGKGGLPEPFESDRLEAAVFSGLSLGEAEARYSLPDTAGVSQKQTDLERFPRGEKAGVLIHDIFEHIDFAPDTRESRRLLVRKKLLSGGFHPSWEEALCDLVEKTLEFPLQAYDNEIRLSSITGKDRVSEMEFYFPLAAISSHSIAGIIAPFAGHRQGGSEEGKKTLWRVPENLPERLADLGFINVRGFMRGAMDLVFRFGDRFYLLDWKSNYLGDVPLSYGQDALEEAMIRHLYHFQYLIYLAALHGFLRSRIPGYDYERNFGCVFYVFLRGIASGVGCGVYRARPPIELLDRLCALMMKPK